MSGISWLHFTEALLSEHLWFPLSLCRIPIDKKLWMFQSDKVTVCVWETVRVWVSRWHGFLWYFMEGPWYLEKGSPSLSFLLHPWSVNDTTIFLKPVPKIHGHEHKKLSLTACRIARFYLIVILLSLCWWVKQGLFFYLKNFFEVSGT